MQKDEIKAVWDRYRSGNASEADKALLESWYANYEQPDLVELADEEVAYRVEAVRKNFPVKRSAIHQVIIRRMWPRIAAAACLLTGIFIGGYFLWGTYQRYSLASFRRS